MESNVCHDNQNNFTLNRNNSTNNILGYSLWTESVDMQNSHLLHNGGFSGLPGTLGEKSNGSSLQNEESDLVEKHNTAIDTSKLVTSKLYHPYRVEAVCGSLCTATCPWLTVFQSFYSPPSWPYHLRCRSDPQSNPCCQQYPTVANYASLG